MLLDGEPVRSCLMFAVTVDGHEITTVEGLAGPDGACRPVQQAFAECHGAAVRLLHPGLPVHGHRAAAGEPGAHATRRSREGISGNLCRCTGYQNIVKAVHRAAELHRRGEP